MPAFEAHQNLPYIHFFLLFLNANSLPLSILDFSNYF